MVAILFKKFNNFVFIAGNKKGYRMKIKSSALSASAFAMSMLLLAMPANGQETIANTAGLAIFDMNLSKFDLSADTNNNDFSEPNVYLPNGQARFRLGNFIGEIQGTYSTSVDIDVVDFGSGPVTYGKGDSSSSFGMIGHYVAPMASGEVAFSFGTMGGTQVYEEGGIWFTNLGAGYSQDNWMIGLGRIGYVGGKDSNSQIENFTYVNGSFALPVSTKTELVASGYIGQGNVFNASYHPITGANIDLGVSHKINDQISLSASVGRFLLENDVNNNNQANGNSIKLGISIALGGRSQDARNAIRFDTPDLHREMTWCADAGCGYVPD